MPIRTTVVLPPALKAAATDQARARGISFGEFLRRAVERALSEDVQKPSRGGDPFLDDRAVFKGKTPRDLAQRHDHYLYGDGE
jgi:hypothetical protein